MDFVKNLTGGNKDGEQGQQQGQQQQGEQKSEGGFMSKLNNMAGGGAAGEKKEDGLDKGEHNACSSRRHNEALTASLHTGVDWVQENVLGQGKQDNESAVEQAKDEQISGTHTPPPQDYFFLPIFIHASLPTADTTCVKTSSVASIRPQLARNSPLPTSK